MLLIRKCLLRNGTEAVPYREKSGATADAIAPPRVTLSRYVQFEPASYLAASQAAYCALTSFRMVSKPDSRIAAIISSMYS